MNLFRRGFNWDQAVIRPPLASDGPALQRLLYAAERRVLTSTSDEAVSLLLRDPAYVIEAEGRIMGALGIGWRLSPVAWLRTLVLESRLLVADALTHLLEPLRQPLLNEGIRFLAFTLDDWSTPWLRGPLERVGYQLMVDVVGYHKFEMNFPSLGNTGALVRPGQSADLPAVLALDAACFPAPWIKGPEVLEPALTTSPCFLIAEWGGATSRLCLCNGSSWWSLGSPCADCRASNVARSRYRCPPPERGGAILCPPWHHPPLPQYASR